jgi:hypothetical protein
MNLFFFILALDFPRMADTLYGIKCVGLDIANPVSVTGPREPKIAK